MSASRAKARALLSPLLLAAILAGVLPVAAAAQSSDGDAQQPVGPPVQLLPPDALKDPLPEGIDAPKAPKDIEITVLGEIDREAIGVLAGFDGLGGEVWLGSKRAVVEDLLQRLPAVINSRALGLLAQRLLLSSAPAPERPLVVQQAGDPPVALNDFLHLRAERLLTLGHVTAHNALLASLPENFDDPDLARSRLRGLLLASDTDKACDLAERGVAALPADVFWAKAQVFCQFHAGDSDGAIWSLDLLREQEGESDQLFYFLAAQFQSGGDGTKVAAAVVTPLAFAMMQAAEVPLPPELLSGDRPALLAAIALSPASAPEMRALAAELSVARGALSGADLAKAYEGFYYPLEERAAAVETLTDLRSVAERALLHQAAGQQAPALTRAALLRRALKEARDGGAYLPLVTALGENLASLPVATNLSSYAEEGARALFTLGRYEQAMAWLRLARDQGFTQPASAEDAELLWPFGRLSGAEWMPPLESTAALTTWGQRQKAPEDRVTRQRLLLLAAFEALGDPVPWSLATLPTTVFDKPVTDPAVQAAMTAASEAGRTGETILQALIFMGEVGSGKVDPVSLSAVLTALNRVGLSLEARALAIEAAVRRGI